MSATPKHILLVDDEEAFARLLKARLEKLGFTVHTESFGGHALRYAEDHPVDLAILDVNLPDLSGYQVARELRKAYHAWSLPILMLTVKDQPIDHLRGFAHGADAYLTKPFNSEELFQAIALLTGEEALTSPHLG